MTVRLDTLAQVYAASAPRGEMEANLTAARTAGAMLEMGRYAREITVYGSASLVEGQRCYVVSSREAAILEFVQHSLLATPPESLSMSLLTPADSVDDVTRAVKLRLARRLAQDYPLAYFKQLARLTDSAPSDDAQPMLARLQDALEGRFDDDRLQLFAGLMHYARTKGCLTAASRQRFQDWLDGQYRQMVDDAVLKDRFEKTFYGCCVLEADGQSAFYLNACPEVAYRRRTKLQAQGLAVTPIFAKTMWYNHDRTLNDVRQAFTQRLAQVFDDDYLAAWQSLRALPAFIDRRALGDFAQRAREQYGPACANAVQALALRLDMTLDD